jgi:hypothetical protein
MTAKTADRKGEKLSNYAGINYMSTYICIYCAKIKYFDMDMSYGWGIQYKT